MLFNVDSVDRGSLVADSTGAQVIDAGDVATQTGSGVLAAITGDDLNTNLVRLEAGSEIATSANPEVDVLLVVLQGEGELTVDGCSRPLRAGTLVYVPKETERSWRATTSPLVYVTAHRRRSGLQIRRRRV